MRLLHEFRPGVFARQGEVYSDGGVRYCYYPASGWLPDGPRAPFRSFPPGELRSMPCEDTSARMQRGLV